MTNRTTALDGALYEYFLAIQPNENSVQLELRQETSEHPLAEMQISPEQAHFLAWLVKAFKVKTIIELGVFTGYSALAMAQALPHDGRLIACDLSEEWTAVAEQYWQQAGVRERIDLRVGPALQTLQDLLDDNMHNKIDLIFIDADKPSYPDYYELGLRLLRPDGLLVLDNVFLMGRVLSEGEDKETARSMRALNQKIRQDYRVDAVVLPLSDGVSLVRKL